jgi:glycerol-3-phosphate acyltransferase PlsY
LLAILLIVGAYLLGAIPFGLLIGLARGVDIREQGSRNIGATNAGRVLGRKWGYLCLVLDVLKGLAPALCASLLIHPGPVTGGRVDTALLIRLAVALAAVLGHVYPIYLGFRGGKGVATTVGVALGIWPDFTLAMAAALVAYAAARFGTGLVSVGSLTLAVLFPVAVYVVGTQVHANYTLGEFWPLPSVALLFSVLIFVRHRSNIQRLLRGEERGTRPAESTPPGDRA